jgi:hypothetical protein
MYWSNPRCVVPLRKEILIKHGAVKSNNRHTTQMSSQLDPTLQGKLANTWMFAEKRVLKSSKDGIVCNVM